MQHWISISFHKHLIKILNEILKNSFNTDHETACILYFLFPKTATHVKARHELLDRAIGVFPEEKQAYETISMLSWILPLIVIIGCLVDTVLVVVYMRLAHPWKDILFGQMTEMEEEQTIESTDIQITQSEIQVRFPLFIETGKHS